ncbi:ArsR family transcriptional regulator [Streptomyces sp. NPDC008150]|uniref:ArsR/SmtB family transcription factor n=1 Tax=Streptomyces sp. NPDC008150 TaxID=3364816 RepID=UPI0036E13478
MDEGLDALLYTPKSVLRRELEELAAITSRPLPSWTVPLADGSPRVLEAVGQALRDWHRSAIEPVRTHLRDNAEKARLSAARTLIAEGVGAMLSRLHPSLRWTPPVLELVRPDLDTDLHLNGRGLRLVPSMFCGRQPVIVPSHDTPVLAFPLSHDAVWAPTYEPPARTDPHALAALLGRTRATVLLTITAGHGLTTSVLANRTGVSQATVSHHTTALRDAGLISTHRAGPHAHHAPTQLGTQLVHGTQRHSSH